MPRRHYLWLLVAAALLAGGIALSLLPVGNSIEFLRRWFDALGAAGFLAFATAYIIAAVLLIPVWPFSITAGLVFGAYGFVLVPVSATLGATIAFLVSRYFVRGKVRDWLGRRLRYQAVDKAVAEEGWKIVALLRLSPLVPYNFMNYFCGMSRIALVPYILATFLGTVPVTALYVYLGYVGYTAVRGDMGWPQWAMLITGVGAAIAATLLITRKIGPRLQPTNHAGSTSVPRRKA
jgi:uncharacterized membrane protein YdjX (TVP38/TMEM64 family)